MTAEANVERWQPNAGPQCSFLRSTAYEALYGGAAGGGKSEALVAGGLRWIESRHYTGIIFRRTYPELERSLIPRSQELYRACDGRFVHAPQPTWRFPTGARIYFGHLQHEHSVFEHQSAEYQYIAFDELTHFTESQYRYLLSRGRSSKGLPVRIRSGTNPGGEGHGWVFKRFGAWLDPEYPNRAGPGEARWFVTENDRERECDRLTPNALSRVFFPALLKDNPKGDPTYGAKLQQLDAVTRAQLLHGDWLARAAPGLLFKRPWFEIVDHAPEDAVRVRVWDRAATEPHDGNPDPDFTVGARWALADGVFYVEHVDRFRARSATVKDRIKSFAKSDPRGTTILLLKDPGQAGVAEFDSYVTDLAGFDIQAGAQDRNKELRARPASAQAENKRIKLVRAAWNDAWLDEHEAFPTKGVHDDQVDTTSSAVDYLAEHAMAPLGDDFWALQNSAPRLRM